MAFLRVTLAARKFPVTSSAAPIAAAAAALWALLHHSEKAKLALRHAGARASRALERAAASLARPQSPESLALAADAEGGASHALVAAAKRNLKMVSALLDDAKGEELPEWVQQAREHQVY